MWKYIARDLTAYVPAVLNRPRLTEWPWRKILADTGLLAAFALTCSVLLRG